MIYNVQLRVWIHKYIYIHTHIRLYTCNVFLCIAAMHRYLFFCVVLYRYMLYGHYQQIPKLWKLSTDSELLRISFIRSLNISQQIQKLYCFAEILFVSFRLAWNHCINPDVCSRLGWERQPHRQPRFPEDWKWLNSADGLHNEPWRTDHWTWGTHIGHRPSC